MRELFAHSEYQVPLYQRAYAWTSSEILTLLTDIRDARKVSESREGGARDYYIGSLVVNAASVDGRTVYEVVDGQQRLTTAFVILAVTRQFAPWQSNGQTPSRGLDGSLTFEGRQEAKQDLLRLRRDGDGAIAMVSNPAIRQAAELVTKALALPSTLVGTERENDELSWHPDLEYFLDHVKILRTELPQGTDLNHYFEVMNTRGEQLEKHEILKAQLLSRLDSSGDRSVFAQIWDAVSIFDRHIQVQFTLEHRSTIFGPRWDAFPLAASDALFDVLRNVEGISKADDRKAELSLAEVLGDSLAVDGDPDVGDSDDEATGRYQQIIDFPNFLLQVLKLQRGDGFSWGAGTTEADTHGLVRLEDKYLLTEFAAGFSTITPDAVRKFGFLLLKFRFFLDSFIIRTLAAINGNSDENWVIHQAFRREYDPKDHTHRPKDQLTTRPSLEGQDRGARTERDENSSTGYARRRVRMLQSMFQVTDTRRSSKYFLYVALSWLEHNYSLDGVDADSFGEHLEQSARERLRTVDLSRALDSGTQVPNFVFNFLDYLLWKQEADPANTIIQNSGGGRFQFRYRTSVEHFYPSHPAEEQGHARLEESVADNFGNLCIMSRSENSRRNNLMPMAKVAEFADSAQSLKFQRMAKVASATKTWGETEILAHGQAMKTLLEKAAKG